MPSLFKANEWYAIQVKGRQEIQVSQVLHFKGYETLLPVYKARKRWSDRNKIVELPLFPGYVFCRFDPQIQSKIISTPGVISIVGFGSGPVPVREEEIASLKILMESGADCQPHSFFHAGQQVEVVNGPLNGVKGVVVSNGRRMRIVISVQLIRGSVVVEVDEDSVAVTTPVRLLENNIHLIQGEAMNNESQDDLTVYKVVVNHEDQYSIWPEHRKNPLGWKDAGKSGLKQECLEYIKEVWTDMRPRSLREKMDGKTAAGA